MPTIAEYITVLEAAKREDETISTIEQCDVEETVTVVVGHPSDPCKPMVTCVKILAKNSTDQEALTKCALGYNGIFFDTPCLRQENWQAKQNRPYEYDFDQDELYFPTEEYFQTLGRK